MIENCNVYASVNNKIMLTDDPGRDILELVGFNKYTGRTLNYALYRLYYIKQVELMRFRSICRHEIRMAKEPDCDRNRNWFVQPRFCGFALRRMRARMDLSVENLDYLPMAFLPFLGRVLQGAAFLKGYMDISAIRREHAPILLKFLNLDFDGQGFTINPEENYNFSEEAARALAKMCAA